MRAATMDHRGRVVRRGRSLASALGALTLLSAVLGLAPSAEAASKAPSWKVGDCFATADVDGDTVDLATKVPCTKPHAVQVLSGVALASLPTKLVDIDRAKLLGTGLEGIILRGQADRTCGSEPLVPLTYPKTGDDLAAAITAGQLVSVTPATPGRYGWVVPDQKSYDAGARDLLCIFEPNPDEVSTKGDVRKLESSQVLGDQRICNDFEAASAVPCGDPHDMEALLFFETPLGTRPADVTTWQKETVTPAEEAACAAIGKVLIGATRDDLITRVFPISVRTTTKDGALVFSSCVAYTTDEKVQLPGGTLMGVGKKKIAFPKL